MVGVVGLAALAMLTVGWWWFRTEGEVQEPAALAGVVAGSEQTPALRRLTPGTSSAASQPASPAVSSAPAPDQPLTVSSVTTHPAATTQPAATQPVVGLAPAAPGASPTYVPTTQSLAVTTHPASPPLPTRVELPFLRPPGTDPAAALKKLQEGLAAKQDGDLLRARTLLNEALFDGLPAGDQDKARQELAELAEATLLSRRYIEDDPLVEWHTLRQGETVGKLAKRNRISQSLVAQMNGLRNVNVVRQGTRIKLLRGPFHAQVFKRTHKMHLYLQGQYVKTMSVALGQEGSTPTGLWRVLNNLENPGWTDPRTSKRWHPDDPANPIGEYWIGLEGIEGDAVEVTGIGIHGTIEPETIGQDVSLGCVRLNADDIALVYRWLLPEQSYVYIRP